MDAIHKPDLRTRWISAEKVHLRQYFSAFRDRLLQDRPDGLRSDLRLLPNHQLMKWMNQRPQTSVTEESEDDLDLNTFEDLQQTCHEDALR